MKTIHLQRKTKAERGTAEKYWFENEHIDLKRTLFHRVHIPLAPFDSGLEYETQPVKTAIVIEWLNLNLSDPNNLDNLFLTSTPEGKTEISIYLGNAHNPCDLVTMNWKRKTGNCYAVSGELKVDFESEGVAKNESFQFETTIELDTETKE